MANFTTNWALKDSIRSNNEKTKADEPVIISKEVKKKMRLIKKAFR